MLFSLLVLQSKLWSEESNFVILAVPPQVMPFAKPRVFNEKAEIFKVSSRPHHVTIVIRGIVHVYLHDKLQRQEGTGRDSGLLKNANHNL